MVKVFFVYRSGEVVTYDYALDSDAYMIPKGLPVKGDWLRFNDDTFLEVSREQFDAMYNGDYRSKAIRVQ